MNTSHRVMLAAFAASLMLAPALAHAGETHQVTQTTGKARVGEKGLVSVTIQGRNGWHVNEEAPVALKLVPSSGVSVDKPKLGRTDLAESTQDRARFDVKWTGSAAGKGSIECEARFVMCQETACKPVTEKLVLALQITDLDESAPAPAEGKRPGKKQRKK